MHNCKSLRNGFIDLALDELSPGRSSELLDELNACPECREDYARLRSTLHVSSQALRSVTPGEGFWPGYHDRLRLSLLASSSQETLGDAPARTADVAASSRSWLGLRMLLTTSIRVPVPVAVAVICLFVISLVAFRSEGTLTPTVVTQSLPVEVRTVSLPVVQEKLVTRVVYVRRKSGSPPEGESDPITTPNQGSVASAIPAGDRKAGLNLVGFEPTDQVRLTIIKGSYRDEK